MDAAAGKREVILGQIENNGSWQCEISDTADSGITGTSGCRGIPEESDSADEIACPMGEMSCAKRVYAGVFKTGRRKNTPYEI